MCKENKKLISSIRRLVRHRERMMQEFGARMTMDKLEAITKIRNTVSWCESKSLKATSVMVLKAKESFYKIMPGESSKFYESDHNKLLKIFSMCESVKEIKNGL